MWWVGENIEKTPFTVTGSICEEKLVFKRLTTGCKQGERVRPE